MRQIETEKEIKIVNLPEHQTPNTNQEGENNFEIGGWRRRKRALVMVCMMAMGTRDGNGDGYGDAGKRSQPANPILDPWAPVPASLARLRSSG